MTPGLPERLAGVRERIRAAADAAGRDPAAITLIAVTKFQPVSLIRDLAELGVRDFGENRHQEAQAKAHELAGAGLRWHFIGSLQTNKARAVLGYADVIHSVDRPRLVRALAAGAAEWDRPGTTDCFIQVSLDGAPGRGGAPLDRVAELARQIGAVDTLHLVGVMAVAPLHADAGQAFARLQEASAALRDVAPDADAVSAGMSHDFEAAIAHGATHLRIGTAITGNRPAHG